MPRATLAKREARAEPGGQRDLRKKPRKPVVFNIGRLLSADDIARMILLKKLKQRARYLKTETFALYLAARDPRTPWYAKLLVAGIVPYAFSPIDLIPDFVPVLGYLDDLILIPLGITLAIKLVPHSVLDECRTRAQQSINNGKPISRVAGAVIVVIWLVLTALSIIWGYEAFSRNAAG